MLADGQRGSVHGIIARKRESKARRHDMKTKCLTSRRSIDTSGREEAAEEHLRSNVTTPERVYHVRVEAGGSEDRQIASLGIGERVVDSLGW